MKVEARINLSFTHPTFRDKLFEKWPKYRGEYYEFVFQGSQDSVDYRDILSFLFEEGFTIGPPLINLDSKQFFVDTVFRFEEEDLEFCEYFSMEPTKRASSGEAIVLEELQVGLLTKPLPKFKHITRCEVYWFINKSVKESLEKENFKGLLIFPVEQVKGTYYNRQDWMKGYSQKNKVTQIPNAFALTSSVLINPDYILGEYTFFRSTLKKIGSFDFAVSSSDRIPKYCSQRFYQFWKANFDDIEFSPTIII